jgi:hypothetical protein
MAGDNAWMFDGSSKYLDGKDMNGNRTAFSTFPRMGNTQLRMWI